MDSIKTVNTSFETNHKFWYVFHAKYSANCNKNNEFSKWWPEWYKYTLTSQLKKFYTIIKHKLDLICYHQVKKHIQWATLLHLYEPYLVH